MPLARYFLFVGGVLLALLSISDDYLPKLAVSNRAISNSAIIRIHPDQNGRSASFTIPACLPPFPRRSRTWRPTSPARQGSVTSSKRWSGKHLRSCDRPMPISYNGPIQKSENRSCNVNAKKLQRGKRLRLRVSWRGNRSFVGLATTCGESINIRRGC